MAHPDKTLLGEPVVYHHDGTCHVALVMDTHDDDPHKACLVFYCPKTHQWLEVKDVSFSATPGTDGTYSNVG